LLEGLVFGARAGETAATENPDKPAAAGSSGPIDDIHVDSGISTAVKKRVKRVMWERVGILRDRDSLARAIREFDQIARADLAISSRYFVTLASLVARAAMWREESRGGHFRTDFPETIEKWRVHSVQKLDTDIATADTVSF
jgi:L-aspartate oxidase